MEATESGNCWKAFTSKKFVPGKVYYFNESTGESVWEKPKGYVTDELNALSSVRGTNRNNSSNSQIQTKSKHSNMTSNYCVDQCNELVRRDSSLNYQDTSLNYQDTSKKKKKNSKKLNEEELDDVIVHKSSQSLKNRTDSSIEFGNLTHESNKKVKKVSDIINTHEEVTPSSKRRRVKKRKVVGNQEQNQIKQNEYLHKNGQHTPAQDRLNKLKKKLLKRQKKANKRNGAVNDLRNKLVMKNVVQVQEPLELSDSFNHVKEEEMEWEPAENEQIYKSIICARKEIQNESCGTSEMEWITSCADQIEFETRFYIVLDTNVLITSINFIKKLRDMTGSDSPLLLVPYQVLLELDHLKRRKSSVANMGARQAIDVIYQTFKSDYPRIHGQSASEAQEFSPNLDKKIPDDAIINCCLQQQQKGNDVVLLTLDKNLSSKAIMNGVKVYAKNELSQKMQNAKRTSLPLKQAIFGDGTVSVVRNSRGQSKNNVTLDAQSSNTVTDKEENSFPVVTKISGKLEESLLKFIKLVVARGMYLMYGEQWEARCIIKPPWDLQKSLRCLSHHWYAIMDSFASDDIKNSIKTIQKAFSENESLTWTKDTIGDVLEASSNLSSTMSTKYTTVASSLTLTVNELKNLINEQLTTVGENNIEPVGTDEQAAVGVAAFSELWRHLNNFCTALYVALGWEDRPQNSVGSTPPLIVMKDNMSVYYTSALNLFEGASGVLSGDFEELTVTHPSVVLLYKTVYEFLEQYRGLPPIACDISVQNILAFCTRKEFREKLASIISPLEELCNKLMRCIDHFVKTQV